MNSPKTKKKGANAAKEIPIQDVKLLKKINLLEFENEQLKTELQKAKEQVTVLELSRNDLRTRLTKCYVDLEVERSSKSTEENDMRLQYSLMQKEWLLRNHELTHQLEEMHSHLEKSNLAIEELKAQKEAELSKKDAIITDQVHKMEHMATEFSDMLNETLQKMSERIELKMNERKFLVVPEPEAPTMTRMESDIGMLKSPSVSLAFTSSEEFLGQRTLIQKSLSRLKNPL
eukprot:Phypoly_transcript_04063.p2 GENE.Phypoly_transcript_04063~~Phypoly_transcript_04063.p2  ORF type:complete len:231 (+),score=40.33 Phypoly_transcript_04063:184-876(+)